MLFWPISCHFWCLVVILVTFSSNLSNFENNPLKKIQKSKKQEKNKKKNKKIFRKLQKSPKIQKSQKISKNPLFFLNPNFLKNIFFSKKNPLCILILNTKATRFDQSSPVQPNPEKTNMEKS